MEKITTDQMFLFIEEYTGITKKAMLSDQRYAEVVQARMYFIFLSKKILNLTNSAIGRLLRKDHSTIIYFNNKIATICTIYEKEKLLYSKMYNHFLLDFPMIQNKETVIITVTEENAERIINELMFKFKYKQNDTLS